MNLSCQLYVDGVFDGIINSDKEITVGQNGCVKGEIVTDRLVIHGTVEGNVNANKVEIKASGKVSGTIESLELLIESKGIFEGSSIVKKAKLSTHTDKQKTDKK